MKLPDFVIYTKPLIEVLRDIGGSVTTADAIDKVIEHMNIPEEEVAITFKSGSSRVRQLINWARLYLVRGGLMDESQHGVWTLTEKGYDINLADSSIDELLQEVHKIFSKPKSSKNKEDTSEIDEITVDDETHKEIVLSILKELTPSGFEQLCKRLLTETGMNDVQVTGGPGDQGIDGIGKVRVNDIVSINVIFQCKRYKDAVGPHEVRDFRGTMQGRADKGIIITTSRFSASAKQEAERDGVDPIELIDGERLVTLLEKYKLGLKPKVAYDVDLSFFDNYK